ncbi:hypothetical protein [Aneurinibacillus sp. REN35]|uniref:hypothetical protein n=1 Tax=Aneurinibacillus sp. REN35 TaxID=3237286 RepID=UPI00352958B0
MTIQFLDMRTSQDGGGALVAATSRLIGDIGLQTAGVSAANAGSVRVQLWGYAKVAQTAAGDTVTVTIQRNGATIFSTTLTARTALEQNYIAIDPADFPPAAAVLAGQIRYTMTIVSSAAATLEDAGLGGEAVAGNFTG